MISTVIASGSTACGCGFTTTALPVTRLANMPGYAFHVGNVEQPIVTSTPRGTMRYVFSTRIGSGLAGFSHITRAGMRDISSYAYATASSARSCACGPPA